MSARERLEDLMIGIYGMPDEKVLRMLDAYAHELAEEIRAKADKVRAEDWGRSNRSKRPWLMGMEAARKVIDPEKQS